MVLDEEVHVFPDNTFSSTFAKDEEAAHRQDEPFLGLVEKTHEQPATSFMDLPPGLTNEGKDLPGIEPFPNIQ